MGDWCPAPTEDVMDLKVFNFPEKHCNVHIANFFKTIDWLHSLSSVHQLLVFARAHNMSIQYVVFYPKPLSISF